MQYVGQTIEQYRYSSNNIKVTLESMVRKVPVCNNSLVIVAPLAIAIINFLQPQYKCLAVPQPPTSKSKPPCSVAPLFFKEYFNLKVKIFQNGKQTNWITILVLRN